MSREITTSINMPDTALWGDFGAPNGVRFTFNAPHHVPGTHAILEKPVAQAGKPGIGQPSLDQMREDELVESLRDAYGENWPYYMPITEEQPHDQEVTSANGQKSGVIFDTPKEPTHAVPEVPTATSELLEIVPSPTPQSVELPKGRIVPYEDYFIAGAVFTVGLAAAGGAVVYRNELLDFKRKRIDTAMNRAKETLIHMKLNYLLERDFFLETLTGDESMQGIEAVRDHMAQTDRYRQMLHAWSKKELRNLKELAKDAYVDHGTEPVTSVLQAMTICRALNEQGKPTTPTTILLLLQTKHEPSGKPGEIAIRQEGDNLVLTAYGEVYKGLSSQQIANRLKGAPEREKARRKTVFRRARKVIEHIFKD